MRQPLKLAPFYGVTGIGHTTLSFFSSLMLIAIMSLSGMIPSSKEENHNQSIGHFYLVNIGHYHFAVTAQIA